MGCDGQEGGPSHLAKRALTLMGANQRECSRVIMSYQVIKPRVLLGTSSLQSFSEHPRTCSPITEIYPLFFCLTVL